MDKPFIEYATGLLSACGIKADDPKLAELKEKLGDFSLGEENQKLIDFNVMTREAAKANSDVFNHHKATFMYKVDKALTTVLEAEGFSEDEVKDFKNAYKEKTVDAVKGLHDKIRDKYQKALDDLPKGAGKEEIAKLKESYNKQVEDLNNAVKTKEGEISQIKQAHESQLIDMEVSGVMNSKNYSSKYDKSHALIIADTLVKKELNDQKIKLVRDTEGIKLKLNDETQSDYYQNNEKVTLDGFVTGVLAKNNLLAAQTKANFHETAVDKETAVPQGAKEMANYYADLKAQTSATS